MPKNTAFPTSKLIFF